MACSYSTVNIYNTDTDQLKFFYRKYQGYYDDQDDYQKQYAAEKKEATIISIFSVTEMASRELTLRILWPSLLRGQELPLRTQDSVPFFKKIKKILHLSVNNLQVS